MDKEAMMNNLQEHQYTGNGSTLMSGLYFAFGNPITDSMVVNAYAKTNKAAFQLSLNTGVAYANHSVMGGNFLYNTFYNTKLVGKKLGLKAAESFSKKPFQHIPILNKIKPLRDLNFNFISRQSLKGGGIGVEEVASKTGMNAYSDVVRTGFGFGKDYSGFFGALKDLGYNAENFDDRVYEREIVSRNYKGTVNKRNHSVKKTNRKIQRKIKFSEKADDVIESAGLDVEKTSSIKRTTVDAVEWNAKNLSDDLAKVILEGSDDKVTKLADEFIRIGGKLSNYTVGSKTISKEVREELIEKAGKFFASRTTFQKIISSPLVRIATGAAIALPASVSIPLMVATTGIGMAALIGQENAINNFINSHLYNTNQYDQYSSAEATSSIYSAANIRNANLQALANSYQNINVANRYLNDMDPISSDYSYKLDDTETM